MVDTFMEPIWNLVKPCGQRGEICSRTLSASLRQFDITEKGFYWFRRLASDMILLHMTCTGSRGVCWR